MGEAKKSRPGCYILTLHCNLNRLLPALRVHLTALNKIEKVHKVSCLQSKPGVNSVY